MNWQFAEISKIITENYRTKTFQLIPQETLIFQSGNHIDVRLTSQNGYQTQRSYSISSHPEKKSFFEITVELIEDGEVSPYFFNEIIEGDKIEFRGPVGGPFKWTPQMGGPLLLLAGGSGIAPLRSIIYSEGEKYIKILENGNIVDKLVITGLKGDNGLVEIISGIKEGDEIITFINDKD